MPTVTPRGSRRIMDVKPLSYSPVDLPSWQRAAPAKKRRLSDMKGMSSLRDGDRLADVNRLEAGELVAIGVDGVGELQEHAGAFFRRRVEPDLVVGLLRRGHGAVDVLGVGDGDLGDRFPGGRVDVVTGLAVAGSTHFPPMNNGRYCSNLSSIGAAPFANRVPGRWQR